MPPSRKILYVDFTSFETFIGSLVRKLSYLRNVNEKMVLNGDINMYLTVSDVNELNQKSFVTVTNDLSTLTEEANQNGKMIGITLLKENTPILYSPYYFDLGDTFSKNAAPNMYIKEMVNFDLLVDISDIIINIDPNRTNVVNYVSNPIIDGNLTLVDDLHVKYTTTFCKYALTSKSAVQQIPVVQQVQTQAVPVDTTVTQ